MKTVETKFMDGTLRKTGCAALNTVKAHSNRIPETRYSNKTLTELMQTLVRNYSSTEIRQYVDRRIGALIRLSGGTLVETSDSITPLKLEFGLEQLSAASRAVVEQSLETVLNDMNATHTASIPVQDSKTTSRIKLVSGRTDETAEHRSAMELTTEVASALAHKLRNYLAAIISAGEQLEETISGKEVEDGMQLAHLISRAAQEQRILVDRFVQAFGPIKQRCQKINLYQNIRSNIEQLQLRHGYSITCECGYDQVNGTTDPDLLGRIVTELATNAAEVSPQGNPTVHWHTRDGRLVIRVSNTGAINPDQMYGSFLQPFFTDKPGHTGLGLNIALRAAESLGGTLRPILLQDRTTIVVSIPFQIEDSTNLYTERNS